MTSRIEGMENNLNYCYDRGEQYIDGANQSESWRARIRQIDEALEQVNRQLPAERQMKKRVQVVESTTHNEKPVTHPQALRRAMEPNLVKEALKGYDADIEETRRTEMASEICSSFCKIFAILLNIMRGDSITDFINMGIDDSCLPLQGKSKDTKYGALLKNDLFFSIEEWEKSDWQNFFHWQWTFITPFFARPKGKVLHYTLNSGDILPIIDRQDYSSNREDGRQDESDFEQGKPLEIRRRSAAYGGHSTVSKIRLDPLSYDFDDFPFQHQNDWYALKQLTEPSSWTEFLSEIYVWKLFNAKGENKLHISPLLCTFQRTVEDFKTEYFLLFPWASGDLRRLWENNPSGGAQYTSCWMAEQCWKIAEALSVIHQDQEENNPPKPGELDEKLFGRHGDIKPANILWFNEHVGCENAGTLVLSDFGIAKCHRSMTKSLSDPARAKNSPSYRSPEFDIRNLKIGRKSDIWGLACTWIEFVTWYLKGWQAVKTEFPDIRDETDPTNKNISIDTYFRVTEEGAIVKPQVLDWMRKLHRDDRCSHFLHDFLSFIEKKMLVVDPSERTTACDVVKKLKELYEKAMRDSTYANSILSKCPPSC